MISRRISPHDLVIALAEQVQTGDLRVVDLTWPLDSNTPTIQLPPPKVSPPGFRLWELSRYDHRGQHEYWNAFEMGEHVGTHFDAPIHWFTGRHLEDVGSIAPERLLASGVVVDVTAQADRDSDFLLDIEDVKRFEADHGLLPPRSWLLIRTGWGRRYPDPARFRNPGQDGKPHWPGLTVGCARWLAGRSELLGVGIDTIGTDAGISAAFDPAHPAHHFLHGAGKYGMSSLANLDQLPAAGFLLITAPLRIAGGSGSPVRALALVPTQQPNEAPSA